MACRYDSSLASILAQAHDAYRRRDDDGFAALLEQAIAIAPQRLDLHFCLANKHVQTDHPDLAAAIYERIYDQMPNDVDTLFLLAHWKRYLGDPEAEAFRWRLAGLRPDKAVDLKRIWEAVDAWLERPVDAALPRLPEGVTKPAVVVLGHKLAPDGSILPPLRERLEKALEAAERYPASFLVASGGLPQAGQVEAQVMREWLTERGVAAERIHEEGYARDTVENLIFSRYIVDLHGADAVIVITSGYNVRRAGASMEVLAGNCGGGWPVYCVSGGALAFQDDGKDRLKVYRDIIRAYGVPMMAAYPELAER